MRQGFGLISIPFKTARNPVNPSTFQIIKYLQKLDPLEAVRYPLGRLRRVDAITTVLTFEGGQGIANIAIKFRGPVCRQRFWRQVAEAEVDWAEDYGDI